MAGWSWGTALGAGALLWSIATLFVVLCPFTKVEESMHLQATHDVLFHGADVQAYGTEWADSASLGKRFTPTLSRPPRVSRRGAAYFSRCALPRCTVLAWRRASLVWRLAEALCTSLGSICARRGRLFWLRPPAPRRFAPPRTIHFPRHGRCRYDNASLLILCVSHPSQHFCALAASARVR